MRITAHKSDRGGRAVARDEAHANHARVPGAQQVLASAHAVYYFIYLIVIQQRVHYYQTRNAAL